MLFSKFVVKLIGFHNQTVYTQTVKAVDSAHAFRIVSAIYNNCFKRCEVQQEMCVWYKHINTNLYLE